MLARFELGTRPDVSWRVALAGEGADAELVWEGEVDGVAVNGVDIIRWNSAGQIVEFKVMLRPLKAINLIHQKMAAMLQAAS